MITDDIKQSLDVLGLYKVFPHILLMTLSHLYPWIAAILSSSGSVLPLLKQKRKQLEFIQRIEPCTLKTLDKH